MSVENAHHLGEDDKMMKLLNRVQNYIEVTNVKLLTGGEGKSNLKGLFSIYLAYVNYEIGTPAFFKKVEQMLEKDLKNKEYKLEVEEICPLLNALAVKKSVNENIWQVLLSDFDQYIKMGTVNNLQIFYLMRSLFTVDLLDGDVTKTLVDYLIKRGYDSEDFMQMSSKNGGHRRAVHMISIVSQSKPDLKNKNFLKHVEVFT